MSRLAIIFVRDYELQMSIGIYPEEKQDKQRVIVNIEAECLLPETLTDEIEQTVSYEGFVNLVRGLSEKQHYNLAEVFAEDVAAEILKDVRVQKVHVRCEKPDIFKGNPRSVGVSITRGF